jgi:hypothetical protein
MNIHLVTVSVSGDRDGSLGHDRGSHLSDHWGSRVDLSGGRVRALSAGLVGLDAGAETGLIGNVVHLALDAISISEAVRSGLSVVLISLFVSPLLVTITVLDVVAEGVWVWLVSNSDLGDGWGGSSVSKTMSVTETMSVTDGWGSDSDWSGDLSDGWGGGGVAETVSIAETVSVADSWGSDSDWGSDLSDSDSGASMGDGQTVSVAETSTIAETTSKTVAADEATSIAETTSKTVAADEAASIAETNTIAADSESGAVGGKTGVATGGGEGSESEDDEDLHG